MLGVLALGVSRSTHRAPNRLRHNVLLGRAELHYRERRRPQVAVVEGGVLADVSSLARSLIAAFSSALNSGFFDSVMGASLGSGALSAPPSGEPLEHHEFHRCVARGAGRSGAQIVGVLDRLWPGVIHVCSVRR